MAKKTSTYDYFKQIKDLISKLGNINVKVDVTKVINIILEKLPNSLKIFIS